MIDPIVTIDATTYYRRKPDKSRTLEVDFDISTAIDCSLLIEVADTQGLASHELKILQFSPAHSITLEEYLVDGQFIAITVSTDEPKERIIFEVRDRATLLVPICGDGGAFQFSITKAKQKFSWEDEGAA